MLKTPVRMGPTKKTDRSFRICLLRLVGHQGLEPWTDRL